MGNLLDLILYPAMALFFSVTAYYHFFIKAIHSPRWSWKILAFSFGGMVCSAIISTNLSPYQVLSFFIAYSACLLMGFAEPKKKLEESEKE
ncbi:MAG: hypothetical protein AAGB12_15195 [Pseudomonadota bacterium]